MNRTARWLMNMTAPTAVALALASAAPAAEPKEEQRPMRIPHVVLAIHGGLGMAKEDLTDELEKEIRAKLAEALDLGRQALDRPGATSLDAVERAIRLLEDSPLFNAGKGAVFTHEGRNELDASIMEGKTKRAGAVAGVTIVKNPISAARAVMERSKHVMLIGRGAEVFASKAGLEIVDPSYFWTLPRWRQIENSWKESKTGHVLPPRTKGEHEWGTVGAVAVDAAGNLAAGTSTGGTNDKQFGRVGDSPIIGAGTYADNAGCAVSCTGHGEYFIRFAVSHEINSLVKYRGLKVDQAADQVVNQTLKQAGGEGGAIVLDAAGNYADAYNSDGLYRGYITKDGKAKVLLYAD
ncbi:MAG TPA: isoaspartyl peptidase/L-asparaginase [Pirellulales bacterium]|nr:isoaspartyl peptidase/L-asparaginase [Pirellulales bacterium]